MSKRSNSGLERTSSNDAASAAEPLPVATAVWSSISGHHHHHDGEPVMDVEAQAQVMMDPLLSSSASAKQTSPISNVAHGKKNDNEQFLHVTNEQTHQYWGRFDDPTVSAVYATDDVDDANEPVATARPDDRHIRMQFIRKVYTILSLQLLCTFGVCAVMELHAPTRAMVAGNMGLYWFSVVGTFGTLLPLHCYKRQYPINFILLAAFTLFMSICVGMITSLYAAAGAGDLVLEAVAITASVFVGLTIFTLQSKWDFSFMGAGLGMCLWIMILWGFFAMIFGFQTGSVYAMMGAILFSGYIIYDTYMIAERLDPEDYVVAAIELYLDLVNLFLYILRLLSEMDRR